MKVILAGGGTGGHLYPGIAIAEKLRIAGILSLFMVSDRGLEKKTLSRLGYQYVEQNVSAFSGVGVAMKMLSLIRLVKALVSAIKYIGRGDKVLLLGGFAAAPVALAGIIKGVDLYVHEQNSVMGLLNRMMSSRSRKVFLSYGDTKMAPAKGVFVGNPIRNELMHGVIKEGSAKRILVLGGSGGSRIINITVASVAEKLLREGYFIHHQTGEKLLEETIKEYEKSVDLGESGLQIEAYITDMAQAYAAADIVVARSGSGAVFETMYAKRPALFIPFARSSNNHQYSNALYMQKLGCAEILKEEEFTSERFIERIFWMFSRIEEYQWNLSGVETRDSAELIIRGMELQI